MAAPSSDYLDVDEVERQPRHNRSRSGGYADHIEEQSKRERHDRERQMKLYHDSRYGGSTSASRQRSAVNRLSVPIFENNSRRNRSTSEAERRRDESSPGYNVREVRPGPSPIFDYALTSEPVLPSQLPTQRESRPRHHKKPSIKVEIHQDHPPPLSSIVTNPPTKKSPNASPRSPTAQPQLQYQYETLQNKFIQIINTCVPYLKVEAASPQDLTFSTISEQVAGFAFDLQVWAHAVNVKNLAKIDSRKRKVVEAASRNLDRLIDGVAELNEACSRARPKDLRLDSLFDIDDDALFVEVENGSEPDPTTTTGFIIHACLHSIEGQMGTLKRLSRSLQEASPDAKDEVVAVTSLVEEVALYFGSREALSRYAIDDRFVGRKAALEKARSTAAY